jgi:outer membrane receptor for ferrienterochelin and colicins
VLSLGARYDHDYGFGGTVHPRVALVWNPDESRSWKLLGGTAFRAPNAYELYYDDGSSSGASSDLDPESIRSIEVIHERRFGKTWSTSFSAFHYRIDDLIVQAPDPLSGLLVFGNAESATALGAEFDVEHRFADGARARAAYTWVDTEDDATGERLANSPEHLVKLQFDRPFFDGGLRGAVEVLGMSDRSAVSGAEVDGHLVCNLTLRSTALLPGCELFLGVQNVFDQAYGDPSGPEHVQDEIVQDGRGFFVRLQWSR